MAYSQVWEPNEVFLTHNGVTIYHVYQDDMNEKGPWTFWYGLDPDASDGDGRDRIFDVRTLGMWDDFAHLERTERIQATIKAAIESGEVTPSSGEAKSEDEGESDIVALGYTDLGIVITEPTKPAVNTQNITVIDLQEEFRTVECCICGQVSPSRWGIPVDSETGKVVGNDFAGEWGAKPACSVCFHLHEKGQFVGNYPTH